MVNYKVLYDSWTEVTRESNSNDQWDRDDTDTSHSINGFKIVDKDNYFDDSINFDAEYDRPYFLLYVLYSTGDSFGHDGGQILFLGLFENMETAQRNLERIRNHSSEGDKFSMDLIAEDGDKLVKYQIHVPWVGFFENLEDVCIENVWRK